MAAMKAVPANRYLIFLLIAALGCLADLASKSRVFAWLGEPGGKTWWLFKDFCGLQTSLNRGALFGIGQDKVAPCHAAFGVSDLQPVS